MALARKGVHMGPHDAPILHLDCSSENMNLHMQLSTGKTLMLERLKAGGEGDDRG